MAGALDYLTVPSPRNYGPPPVSSDWIGNLPNDFQQGQQYGYQRNLQTMFRPGTPGGDALASGNYSALLPLIAGAQGASAVGGLLPQLMGQQTMGDALQRAYGGGGQQGAQQPAQGQQMEPQSALPQGNNLAFKSAIIGQESSYNPNVGTSGKGAVGLGQIMPATFAAFARPGERINNADDNLAVSSRIIDKYLQDYNGDRARAAVAYFSGPGNVAPVGSQTPWKRNLSDGHKLVSQYVPEVLARANTIAARMGNQTQTKAATPGQSDQLNPANRAALNASYQARPVGTSPVAADDEEAQPAAVEQPDGAHGTPPFAPQAAASNNVATGPAGITGPQQQPTQVAQTAPQQGVAAAGPVPPGYTAENAQRLLSSAANKQQVASTIAGKPGVTKEFVESLQKDAASEREQGQKINDFLADRSKEQFGVGIAGQKEEQTAYQKKYETLGQSAVEATKELQKSGVAKNIMSDPSYISGFGAGRTLNFQRAVAAFDPSQANVAQPQEVMKKFFSDSLRSKIVALSQSGVGRVMRSEVAIMEKANANQENSIASNRTLVEMDERANKMINGLADAADQYADAHNGRLDHGWEAEARKYIKANPMFTDKETEDPKYLAAPQMPSRFKTRAEVDDWARKMQLQPGEPVRLPNGNYQFWKG